MRIGVIALQGGFARHLDMLRRVGAEAVETRRSADLETLDGLVLPGGESTTLLHLMRDEPWFDALRAFHASGRALFGTCAGAILLAREVRNPGQASLGLLDAAVERNGWGRQLESFEADLSVSGIDDPVPAVFIRAPRFVRLGDDVEVLASCRGEAVLVREDHVLAATFHPELTDDDRLHRMFVDAVSGRHRQSGSASTRVAS